mgnify:CR=1 FL=1
MLKLARQQILLGQSVATKADAIALLAGKLTDAGLVEAGYVDGMLAREAQHATYLGSGIAIPHGTTDTRHLVKSTGVMVAQFPHGIEWDEGQIAYVAIGIAAEAGADTFVAGSAVYGAANVESAIAELISINLRHAGFEVTLAGSATRNWAVWVRQRLQQPGTVFVAVGAGHLAGPGSVQDALKRQGVETVRVQ